MYLEEPETPDLAHDPALGLPTRTKFEILGAILLAMFLGALDQTIVGPVLPRIVGDLNGAEYYTWVVTAYLLTSTVTVPIYGKVSDLYGRRPLLMLGIVLFIVGSALSGLSQTMWQLILFRGLQGLGAGALFPIALAVIGDLFTPAERGKYQGLFGAVFGVAFLLGPGLGGFLTDNLSWHAVFYVNVPIGIVGTLVAWLILPRPAERRKRVAIDYRGAVTFSVALAAFMLVLTQVTANNWISHHKTLLLLLAVASMAAFYLIERRTREPFIKLGLFRERNFTIGNVSGMFSYMALFAPMFLLPFYLEKILGLNPERAGTLLTPVPMALSVVALGSGYLSDKFGVRLFTVGGMLLTAVSLYALSTLHHDSGVTAVVWRLVLLGVSLGLFTPPNNRSVMCAAPEADLSVAGGLLNMMRSLGMMCGVAFAQMIYSTELHDLIERTATAGPLTRAVRHHEMMLSFDKVYFTMVFVALAAAVLSLVKEREELSGRKAAEAPLEF